MSVFKNLFTRVFGAAPAAATTQTAPAIPISKGQASPIINIIDKSTLLSNENFEIMVEACKIQLDQHVAPLWNRGTWQVVKNQPESVGYPIVIVDDPDQAGALGYHTESPNGKVWGRVFVKPVINNKGTFLSGPLSVSAVLSHEIVEAFCDPYVNLWAARPDGILIAYEAADPVEHDVYDVTTPVGTKVSVSNFVLPAWFDMFAPAGTRVDYMGTVKKSFTMSKGGYIVTFDPKTGKIQNVFGSQEAEEMHAVRQDPHPASRSTRKKSKHSEK